MVHMKVGLMASLRADSLGSWWGNWMVELLDYLLGQLTVGMKASQKEMHLDGMKDIW